MRFAGTRIEGLLGNERTDFGALAQKAGTMDSAERSAYTDMQGKVGAAGITAAGQAEAAKITGAAAASAANSQATGSMLSSIGGIASSAIGAFDGGGGGANMPGVEGIDSTTNYSWNAPKSQYAPGSISSPGWTWNDL